MNSSPLFLRQGGELLRVGQGKGQGLFADHVDPIVQEGPAGVRVAVVGGDDGDEVDAVFPHALGPGHLVVIRIHPVGADAQLRAALRVGSGVPGKAARNQFCPVVKRHGFPVNLSDKSALPSADHTVFQHIHTFFSSEK